MKPDPTRTPEFLSHILEAISRIQAYTRGMSSADFNRDVLVQDAVIRNIEIMGEAARNILTFDPSFAAAHPEIPLRDVYLMRNRVAHGYFSVDVAIVWNAISSEISGLRERINRVLGTG
ncbi:MAG TPA: DUF86 domain-containing protein [Acidobacteriaceae bacterium]|nr:DUF86 domain-containing protein [Acidobacteriaceae bacterium]